MADPFPDEATDLDKENDFVVSERIVVDKYVYPITRFHEHSPRPVYIPSRYLMIKIIKACMGCQSKNDLWFNRPKDD